MHNIRGCALETPVFCKDACRYLDPLPSSQGPKDEITLYFVTTGLISFIHWRRSSTDLRLYDASCMTVATFQQYLSHPSSRYRRMWTPVSVFTSDISVHILLSTIATPCSCMSSCRCSGYMAPMPGFRARTLCIHAKDGSSRGSTARILCPLFSSTILLIIARASLVPPMLLDGVLPSLRLPFVLYMRNTSFCITGAF